MSTNDATTDPVLIARIRAARGYANLTQAGLAERLNVSAGLTKRIERGERPLTMGDLSDIANACGVPVDFLLHGFEGARDPVAALSARMDRLEASLPARIEAAVAEALAAVKSAENGS